MFWLFNKVFVALLYFSRCSATEFVALNNEPCFTRPALIDLNCIEIDYYPFMISPDKCNRSCMVADNLHIKICVPSKTKDISVKVFNVITKIIEAKKLVDHSLCNCKCKFNSTNRNSNQK